MSVGIIPRLLFTHCNLGFRLYVPPRDGTRNEKPGGLHFEVNFEGILILKFRPNFIIIRVLFLLKYYIM